MRPAAARPSLSAPLLSGLLLALLGVAVYANSLDGLFILDDRRTIEENPHVRELWGFWSALSGPTTSVSPRPLIGLTLSINYALGGLDVRGYHVFNIAVHVACGLLLFGLIRRTLLGPVLRARFGAHALPLAFLCTAIWLVHPLQTESIDYIVQRTETVMALFFLLTLYAVARANTSSQPGWWYAAAVVSCALGMSAKEVMIAAPPLALLHQVAFQTGSFAEELRRRWGLYAGLAATAGILVALQLSAPWAEVAGFSVETTGFDYLLNQCGAIVHYLRLVFWPSPLSIDYGPVLRISVEEAIAPGLFLIGLLTATGLAARRSLPLAFLGAWFFLILAPSSSVVPVETEVAAERRMYLPLVALIALVVLGGYAVLTELRGRHGWGEGALRGAAALGLALVLVLSVATIRRNRDYRDDLVIWQSAVEAVPGNPRGHNNLGLALYARGRLDEAIGHYQRALELAPGYPDAYNNLGVAQAERGRPEAAVEAYRRALDLRPDYASAHYNLGAALHRSGDLEGAVRHYRRALETEPAHADAQSNLGLALQALGQVEAGIEHLQRAVEIRPDFAEAHFNLGAALGSRGRLEEAVAHYERALEIQSDLAAAHLNLGATLERLGRFAAARRHYQQALALEPDWTLALTYLAMLIVAHPELEGGEVSRAIPLAQRAVSASGGSDLRAIAALAEAYAAAGRIQDALETANTGVALAQAKGNERSARLLRERMRVYEARGAD